MDQEYINRVESYIKGELNADEKRQFDLEIVENSELATIYREYVLAMDAVDHQVESELREKFNSWEKPDAEKSKSVKMISMIWKVAASFILIAGLYFVFIQTEKDFNTRAELALSAYVPPESPGRTMGGKSSDLWADGLDAYEASDFNTAVDMWSAIENPGSEVQFYLAHAYFSIGNYNKSIELFKSLSESGSSYNQLSDWYLLLSYLAADSSSGFNDQLRKITANQKHPYLEKALELDENQKKIKEEK